MLVFLDGHCKPERDAIRRMVRDVEQLHGQAIVTPTVTGLDIDRWKCSCSQRGHGYFLDLRTFDCGWLSLSKLRRVREGSATFYESPAAIGCAVALGRELYERLWGFDPQMRCWGLEDLDLSLKCWLLGFRILHDPEPVVAHRFRKQFDNYDVPPEPFIVNQLRMARKNFTHGVWNEWVARCRRRYNSGLRDHPEGLWARVWTLFESSRESLEEERSSLHALRTRDEFWYAERFDLNWPKLGGTVGAEQAAVSGPATDGAAEAFAFYPSPSPDCDTCSVVRNAPAGDGDVLVGQKVSVSIQCDEGTVSDITWTVPGVVVRNYVVEYDGPILYKAVLTHLDSDYLSQLAIDFFWGDAGTKTVEVSFTLTVDGVSIPCTRSKTFEVQSPTVTTTAPTGIGRATALPGNLSNPASVKLLSGQAPNYRAGMTFVAAVTTPAGFGGEGLWQYTQLVHINGIVRKRFFDECIETTTSTNLVIDDRFVYSNAESDQGPFAANGNSKKVVDSPDASVSLYQFKQLVVNDSFHMYIMYRPPGDETNTIWVPLRSVSWHFIFCADADLANNVWDVKDDNSSTASWVLQTNHPTWTQQFPNDSTKKAVPCPDACSGS